MNERGSGYGEQSEDDLDWSPRSRASEPNAGGRSPMRGAEPARRRTGLIVGAVVAAAAVGVGAGYAGGMFKKDDAAPVATSTPATTPATSGATSAGASTAAAANQSLTTSGAPSSAAGTNASPDSNLLTPTAAARNVGTFYGFADVAFTQGAVPPDAAKLGSVFASKSVQAKYWDGRTNKPQTAAMCGATNPKVAIVATTGDSVTVSFSVKTQLAAQQAQVTVDKDTQKIASIACAKSVAPTYPAARKIVQVYGADQYAPGKRPTSSKVYAPKSANGPAGFMNFDSDVCSQYPPNTWVFYAPVSSTSGDAWQFTYDGDVSLGLSTLFTDPSSGDFERTLCGGFPDIPAPDNAAAGKEYDPASLLVSRIYDAYIYERSQQSAGAKPVDEMAPYFVSAESYHAAQKATGSIPFLCSTKAPDAVQVNGSPSVTDGVETLSLTATYSDSPAPGAKATPVGEFTVSLDLSTMKIKALTCT